MATALGRKPLVWIVIGLCAFVSIIVLYIVHRGAVNYDKLEACKRVPDTTFCGIREIRLALPQSIKDQILERVGAGDGKRVVIQGWKAGRTISTADVKQKLPELWDWYQGLAAQIGTEIGEPVQPTGPDLPTTCAILVYEEDGDFINWHYDVNYFNGRFFTLLIPVTIENSCTLYTYYDKENVERTLPTTETTSILFEGDKTFHMATKFCNRGTKRVIVSVQFSTDPTISWENRILMRVKDSAYIGLGRT